MSDEQAKPTKQPYVTPKLITYGNITTLAQAGVDSLRKADGGGKLKTRTV